MVMVVLVVAMVEKSGGDDGSSNGDGEDCVADDGHGGRTTKTDEHQPG